MLNAMQFARISARGAALALGAPAVAALSATLVAAQIGGVSPQLDGKTIEPLSSPSATPFGTGLQAPGLQAGGLQAGPGGGLQAGQPAIGKQPVSNAQLADPAGALGASVQFDSSALDKQVQVVQLPGLSAAGIQDLALSKPAVAKVAASLDREPFALVTTSSAASFLALRPEDRSAVWSISGAKLDEKRWVTAGGDGAAGETVDLLALEPGDRFCLRERIEEPLVVGTGWSEFGGTVVVSPGTDVATSDEERRPGRYRARVRAQFAPLRWDADRYSTTLEVVVMPVGDETAALARELRQRPLEVSLYELSRGLSVAPMSLTFDAAGQSGQRSVRADFAVGVGASESVALAPSLKLGGEVDERAVELQVRRQLRSFTLTPSNPAPYGLGLETVRFTLTCCAEDGLPIAVESDLRVPLSTGGATGEATALILAGTSAAEFELRTAGTGALRIAAILPGVESAPVSLEQRLPVLLLILCLAGGVVGTLLRGARDRRQFVKGALFGLAAFALGAVGIRAGLVDPAYSLTEVGAFAMAVVVGLAGKLFLPGATDPPEDPAPAT